MRDCFESWYLNHTKFRLIGPATPLEIGKLQMCPTLDTYRKPDEQLTYLNDVAAQQGKVYIVVIKNLVVAYAVLQKPAASSPFSLPDILELAALEVSRYYRHYALATSLMDRLKKDQDLENKIVVSHEPDLSKYNNRDIPDYPRALTRILRAGSFALMPPENQTEPQLITAATKTLFMVKVGARVPTDILCYFKAVRNALEH